MPLIRWDGGKAGRAKLQELEQQARQRERQRERQRVLEQKQNQEQQQEQTTGPTQLDTQTGDGTLTIMMELANLEQQPSERKTVWDLKPPPAHPIDLD